MSQTDPSPSSSSSLINENDTSQSSASAQSSPLQIISQYGLTYFRTLKNQAIAQITPIASFLQQGGFIQVQQTDPHNSTELESRILPPDTPSEPSTSAAPVSTSSTDGVWSNINAKPEKQSLPSYEQAAADAVPPYWDSMLTTSDEIFIDGLPVGHFFGFVWNLLISMSFQFVGFLLTYLLASSHAAKCGSKAGLGVILIQYGFYMRDHHQDDGSLPVADNNEVIDPSGTAIRNEWISLILMIVGSFILARAFVKYYKVRRSVAEMDGVTGTQIGNIDDSV